MKLCISVESKDSFKPKKIDMRHIAGRGIVFGTKVTLHLVRSWPIYVKLVYSRMKITVDNSEGRVQVVCHKI